MVLSPQMVAVWSWAVLGAACLHLHHHSAPAATTSTFTWNRTRGCALRGRRAQQDRTAAMYECCSLFFFIPGSGAHFLCISGCSTVSVMLHWTTCSSQPLVASSQTVFSKPAPISPAAKAIFLPLSGTPVASHCPCALHHNTTR